MPKDTKVKWRAVVYERTTPDGRQIQRAKKGTARNATEAKEAREAARVQLRDDIKQARQWRGSLAELCDDWLSWKEPSNEITTQYSLSLKVDRIKKDIGHHQLRNLTARHLDMWYTQLLTGPKPLGVTSVRQYHQLVKSILEQAFKWDQVPGNVAAKATPPKQRQTADAHHKLLTPEAMTALIARARPALKMCALIAVATGCRRGEILALRWSSIDARQLKIDLALVQVPKKAMALKLPKSNRTRELTLPAELLPLLAEHRLTQIDYARAHGVELVADGPVIADMAADPTGRLPHNPKWLTQAWANHCGARGEVRVECRFHDLRHFHISQLIGHGLDPVATAGRVGHTNPSLTLDVYSRALAQNDEQAADIIGALMFPTTHHPRGARRATRQRPRVGSGDGGQP